MKNRRSHQADHPKPNDKAKQAKKNKQTPRQKARVNFGVNFYLVGLHSYASGDKIITPNFVYYSIILIFILGLASYLKSRKLYS